MKDFQTIREIFSNREIAVFIWILVATAWLCIQSSVRAAVLIFLKALFNKYILISIAALLAYSSLLVFVLYKLNFWHIANLKDTLYWVFGVAFVMFVNVSKAEDQTFFKRLLIGSIKLAIILEFLVKLYDLDLWLELILVPFMTLVIMMKVITSREEKFSQLDKILEKIQIYFGVLILIYIAVNILGDVKGFATLDNIQEFLLPIILTVLYLPFIYMVALYSHYEQIFTRIDLLNNDRVLAKFAKRKILQKFHVNLGGLTRWAKKTGTMRIGSKRDVHVLLEEE